MSVELKNIDLTKEVRYKGEVLTVTAAELNNAAGSTATAAEINVLDGMNATTAELNILSGVTATASEINAAVDVSAQTETIAESGVVSVTKRITKIVSTGNGSITLAAPNAGMLGHVKIIEMTGGNHDITLALTNVVGGSAATTCTWTNTNEALILVSGTNKWHVIAESGVVLS